MTKLNYFLINWGGIILLLMATFSKLQGQEQTNSPDIDSCTAVREIGYPVVLHFDGYSRCYLPLGEEVGSQSVTPFSYKVVDESSANLTTIPITKSQGLYSFMVAPDTDFELVSYNTCGEEKSFVRFSSKSIPPDIITVSMDAMNAVEKWQKNPEGQNFYEMIVTNPWVDNLEKTYLLQQILNKGAALAPEYDISLTTVPPAEAFRKTGNSDECSCTTLQIYATRRLTEYDNCIDVFPNFVCTQEDYDKLEDYTAGLLLYRVQYRSAVEGPAKYERVWGEYARCNNKGLKVLDKARSGVALLRFTLACIDAEWNPKNCRCEQKVNVEYSYLSNLKVNSDAEHWLNCPPFYPTNKAEAYADDGAFLMRLPSDSFDIANGNYEIDSVFRKTLASTCGTGVNTDRYGDLVGFLFAGLKLGLILKGGSDSAGIQTLLSAINVGNVINDLQTYVTNMVTEPWTVNTGSCVSRSDQLLLSGGRIYSLTVENPLAVALVTRSNVRAGGDNAWHAEAKVVSGYHLSGVVVPKFPAPETPYCCTPALANYIVGSMADAYGESGSPAIANLRNEVGIHLYDVAGNAFTGTLNVNPTFGDGAYIIRDELNTIKGRPIPNCKTVYEGKLASQEEVSRTTPPWSVESNSSGIVVSSPETGQSISIKVFDTQGRLMSESQISGGQIKVIENQELPMGYYWIFVTDGIAREVYKQQNFRK